MKGIEIEARQAAKDAARRAGLTLGQWLNQRILDDSAGAPPLHEAGNFGPGGGANQGAEILDTRLGSISRRLDKISDRPPNSELRLAEDMSAIGELQRPHYDPLESRLNRVDEYLSVVHDDVAKLTDRFDAVSSGTRNDVESVVALERALTSVVDHIELADQRNGEVLEIIQARLSELAARPLDGPDAIDGESRAAILTLEDRVSDLAERIENADRGPVIDPSTLERQYADLTRKIEKVEENAGRNPAIEQLDTRVAQLTSKLTTTERMMAAQTEVNALRSEVGKLRDDVARAREPSKPAVVQALESRLNTVSSEIAAVRSNAAPSSALTSLNARLDQILSRLDKAEPAIKAASRVEHLERGLTNVVERLDQAIKVDGQSQVHPRISAFEALERQVVSIVGRLDDTEQHFGALRSIESNLAQLYDSLDGSRGAAIDAAEQAAFNAVRRITDAQAASDVVAPGDALAALERGLAEVKTQGASFEVRNQETLEAIHDTLKRVIERLGVLEENANGVPMPEMPVIEPDFALSETPGDFRLPPMPHFPEPTWSSAGETKPLVPSDLPDPESVAAETSDPVASDPVTSEPDDAENPENGQSFDFAQAYDAPTPSAPRNEDFIAAARRAAQAANDGLSEPSSRRGRGTGDDDQTGLGGLFRGRRRALLFAAAALFLVAGSLSISGFLGRGSSNRFGPIVSSILAPLDRSGEKSNGNVEGKGAAVHSVANYIDALEAADPVQPPSNDQLVKPAKQLTSIGALATTTDPAPKVASAPNRTKSIPGLTVLEPRGAGIGDSMTDVAAMPVASQAPLEAAAETEAGNTEQEAADGEMMTAMAIDPVPASELSLDLPVGEPELAAAAAGGDSRAQFEIGARYAEGRAGDKDPAKAAQWYQRAAAQGLAPAQYRLGALYEKGQGVTTDKGAALIWYQRAAEQGNVKAMHNLAVLLAGGTNGTPDYARAARWFVKAAEFGLADSQFNLAVLHERGLGVERDPTAAYKWFAVAAALGDREAESRMDEIAKQLDDLSRAQASAAAQSWSPKPLDRDTNVVDLSVNLQSSIGKSFAAAPAGDRMIAKAQLLLAALGYDSGPADGFAGPRTIDAIAAFERERSLPESGAITPALIEVLEAASAD